MEIHYLRTVQPESVDVDVLFTEEDIAAAFMVADPDEVLFYQLFSPAWNGLAAADKLRVLARVAELATMARDLNLVATPPENK